MKKNTIISQDNMVKISVITTCYNCSATIRDCLLSVENQHFHNYEHIIVEAKSTDESLKEITSHCSSKCRVSSEPDKGIYDGMNKGISLATGDVIGFLNSDDFYSDNDVLEEIARAFEENDIDCCYGDLQYVDAVDVGEVKRNWIAGNYDSTKIRWGWMPPHPTFYVRKSFYEKFGLYKLGFGTAADYELMIRFLMKHHARVVYIPKVLVKMRTGGASNVNLVSRIKANRMDKLAWKDNGLKPYPWTILCKPLRKIGQWFV